MNEERAERIAQLEQELERCRAEAGPDLESRPAPAVLDPASMRSLRRFSTDTGGWSAAIVEIVRTFLSDMDERTAAIRAALLKEDLAEIGHQAHSLAGSSGALGAAQLAARCRQLETEARQGHIDGLRDIALGLEQASTDARQALEQEFGLVTAVDSGFRPDRARPRA
jgi:HPt (histidine-containing phosphotransfer) domain-containing protein